jgi:S-DNA-T family DNA segregation ATPase FtsK/SpoIIIE
MFESLATDIHKLQKTYQEKRKLRNLSMTWIRILTNGNIYNLEKDTFTLADIETRNYGYDAKVYIPYGMTYEGLEKSKSLIEDGLPCILVLSKIKNKNYANAKIIITPAEPGIFTPPKVKPWEVYIGKGFDGQSVILDMNALPHIFIAGSTGTGKSKLVDHVLTSLICSCSIKELELYLIQVAKEDLYIYEDAEQMRCFCTDVKKTEKMLRHLHEKMHERSKRIIPLKKRGLAGNIVEYNKRNIIDAMSTVYVVIDEFSSLMKANNDSNEIKALKDSIMFFLEEIAQIGRSVGVFLILSLQRPTADKLPPFVKAMCNVKVSFRQTNKRSSEVAMDDDSAVGLEMREAIYDIGERDYLKTSTITDKQILELIKPKLKPGHRTLLFDEPEELQLKAKQHKNNGAEVPEVSKGRVKL